jgi:hypothetical protein
MARIFGALDVRRGRRRMREYTHGRGRAPRRVAPLYTLFRHAVHPEPNLMHAWFTRHLHRSKGACRKNVFRKRGVHSSSALSSFASGTAELHRDHRTAPLRCEAFTSPHQLNARSSVQFRRAARLRCGGTVQRSGSGPAGMT